MHVYVSAFITRPESRVTEMSNAFHFTFKVESSADGDPLRHVIPIDEVEARLQLESMGNQVPTLELNDNE